MPTPDTAQRDAMERNEASIRSRFFIRVIIELVRRFLVTDPVLKVIALVLAVLIWFSVSSDQEQQDLTVYNVPLTVRVSSPELMVLSQAYRVVDVRVRGPVALVSELKADDLSVSLDVTRLGPGTHTVWIEPSVVRAPAGVDVLRVDPSTISITLDAVITRAVPVKLRFDEGSLPPDYVVTGYELHPPTVTITGPRSVVESLTSLSTRTLRLETVNSSISSVVPLEIVSHSHLTVDPKEVRATIFIEDVVERRFEALPLTHRADVLSTSVRVVDVILRGPRSVIAAIDRRQMSVSVSGRGLSPGLHEVTPEINLPTDVGSRLRVRRTEPEKVIIRVR